MSGDGRLWALHPSLVNLQGLFNQGKMGIVANVGPLVAPVTKTDYDNGTAALPPQLFSHSDQTLHWQTAIPDQSPRTGWGGRVADMVEDPVHLPGPIRNLLPILHAPRFPGILALCGRKLDKFHAINP